MGRKTIEKLKLEPSVAFSMTIAKRIDNLLAELRQMRSDRSAYSTPKVKELRRKREAMVRAVQESKEYMALAKQEEELEDKYGAEKDELERRVGAVRRKWMASTGGVTDKLLKDINDLVDWVNQLEE